MSVSQSVSPLVPNATAYLALPNSHRTDTAASHSSSRRTNGGEHRRGRRGPRGDDPPSSGGRRGHPPAATTPGAPGSRSSEAETAPPGKSAGSRCHGRHRRRGTGELFIVRGDGQGRIVVVVVVVVAAVNGPPSGQSQHGPQQRQARDHCQRHRYRRPRLASELQWQLAQTRGWLRQSNGRLQHKHTIYEDST